MVITFLANIQIRDGDINYPALGSQGGNDTNMGPQTQSRLSPSESSPESQSSTLVTASVPRRLGR